MRTALLLALVSCLGWACGGDTTIDGSGGHGGAGTANGAGGSSGHGASGGQGGGAGGAIPCDPPCDFSGLQCCAGTCVNTGNDILNCGGCGVPCEGAHPFCDNGSCAPQPPCDSGTGCVGTEFCCGGNCCALGQLCCVVPGGPLGPPICTEPMNGTCPPGCPDCPCMSPDTLVATPLGDRAIASLAVGDIVWSVHAGTLAAVPVSRVNRVAVHNHHVVRVHLAHGGTFDATAAHPTADGRNIGALVAGDQLGGQSVLSVEPLPYAHAFTYDILPASDSGAYFAGGALIGSTLGGDSATVPPASFAPPAR